MRRNAPGIYNEAQSTIVIGELGRDPVGIDVAANFLGYKDYIKNAKENLLLHKGLKRTKISPS